MTVPPFLPHSALWKAAVNKSYEDMLDSHSLKKAGVYFQQRHLLAHQQGIIDQDYLNKSGDIRHSVGQRLLIAESDVLEFAELIERLGNALIALH